MTTEHETPRHHARAPWVWVQPADHQALLERLALARDLAVPERERENLCACASTEIKRLLRLIDEREALLQEFVDDVSYAPAGQSLGFHDNRTYCCGCHSLRAKVTSHAPGCVVGKAEALLRHTEA